jgi:D-alanyl-D-alanine dipeptidase
MNHEPIPNFTGLRQSKDGYDTRTAIDTEHPLHNDPLVDPRESEFGFTDASSYYSKPNKMTSELLPGVPNAPLVRLDIAKRLKLADEWLRTDAEVRDVLGSPAHIKIDDALRPYEVQKFAHDIAWPMVIRKANPDFTNEEVAQEVPKYVAKPNDKLTPTPHLTGGAVDVALINLETGKPFDRGHQSGGVKGTAFPDFYENYQAAKGQSDFEQSPYKPISREVLLGRRILYYAMTKIGGLSVNPNEIWHYGKGDPLSEYVSGSNKPYYGIAELPEWYTQEMKNLQTKQQTN